MKNSAGGLANFRWLLVALLVLVLDQWTKHLAVANLVMYEPVPLMPYFNLMLAHNTGAAFSFLADAGGWQRWFFVALTTVISVVLLSWLYRLPRPQKLLPIALVLVLGGAIGNVYDRMMYGYVIDFIDWYVGDHHWPAFNIADSAICVGAALLILDSFFKPKEQGK
ncbi:signal peptidase II [Permianibacter sp. IMCC34836]|uniref:signal peptidase II n=1 Tax=Permianibacter fluminis TaxID=2738515 RepID=UPI001552D4E4|nr:signal peptidase II [Permianibacter fluminis]NQD37690.1 signal peptidase II [Permianibacter fluminis]